MLINCLPCFAHQYFFFKTHNIVMQKINSFFRLSVLVVKGHKFQSMKLCPVFEQGLQWSVGLFDLQLDFENEIC